MNPLKKNYFSLRENFQRKLITSSVFINELEILCADAENQNLTAWFLFLKSRKSLEEKNYQLLIQASASSAVVSLCNGNYFKICLIFPVCFSIIPI